MLDTATDADRLRETMEALDASMLTRQPQYARLTIALGLTVEGFVPGEIFAETFMMEALEALARQGRYVVPAWAGVNGERCVISDFILDQHLTAGEISARLNVSVSTVRRHIGAPDTVLGRTQGWRVSTMLARMVKE